jgi:formylmethanofuran dehydrogenase subunit E
MSDNDMANKNFIRVYSCTESLTNREHRQDLFISRKSKKELKKLFNDDDIKDEIIQMLQEEWYPMIYEIELSYLEKDEKYCDEMNIDEILDNFLP